MIGAKPPNLGVQLTSNRVVASHGPRTNERPA